MSALEQAIRQIVDQRLTELGITSLSAPPAVATTPPTGPDYPAVPTQATAPYMQECFKCKAPGVERHNRQTGEAFWFCSDPECGFTNKEGKFYQSNWNQSNWQERYERAAKFGK